MNSNRTFFVAVLLACSSVAGAAELSSVPLYSVAEITFAGPQQSAKDSPARDVQLTARFLHESGSPEITVQGFFDGDGRGEIEGDVFKVRFCATQAGRWTLSEVTSNARELDGQHRGDTLTATASKLRGFWVVDDDSAGRRWYRRSDGSHQYIFGNTMYTFLTEHGVGGNPTGSTIADDMAGNAKYFKKVRFGLQSGQYPHPMERPWLDDSGRPTDDGNYSHRPNPRWFHQRVDLAVRSALEHDLIADMILAGPDTPESRTTLKATHNRGDAAPYLRYIAARYGSFPNVWLCLCNEYDIKKPNYTQAEIAELGVTIRKYLPYPTPLSVHDGSRIGWSAKFDSLPEWADHQIIQRKIRTIAAAADAIEFVWRGDDGKNPRRKPTINDELSYEGAGDKHSEQDTIAAHLGAFLGGGYGTTGEKYGQKLGQYFWGSFDPAKHTAADNLSWLRETIDREITFWQLAPDKASDVFPDLDSRFRVVAWKGHEYVLGTDTAKPELVAKLPAGQWTVTRHNVMAKESKVLSRDASGRFRFDSPDSRAVLFHFKRNEAGCSIAIVPFIFIAGTGGETAAESEKVGRLSFRVHEIGRPTGGSFGQTSAIDVDKDGDLDFISGRQFGDVFWFENQGADKWIQHLIGRKAKTDVGGVAFDVNGDGWVDQVSGGTWFRHPGPEVRDAKQWERFENGATPTHDNLAADIDGDGRLDLVSILDKAGVFWYRIAPDSTKHWIEHKVLGVTDPQCHGGIAVGDIDGDGDSDIARVDRWLENADGKGETWIERITFDFGKVGPWGIQTRAKLVDVDRDGDMDLVQAEGDVLDGRVAWFENRRGNGRNWERHLIKSPGHNQDFHSICVADFDDDGDVDIFSGGGPLTKGEHQWFLWENADGRGGTWTEHVIQRGQRTHESVCGDVDGDGDIDILTKPWRGNLHLFVENLLIDRSKPGPPGKD